VLRKYINKKPEVPEESYAAPSNIYEPVYEEEAYTIQEPEPFDEPPIMDTTKNLLCSDVEIEGSLKFSEELYFDGKIQGEISSGGNLTVGENASISGEINTRSVTIYGRVEGNVTVAERCELKANSELVGDLKAARLMIEEGASFVGKSEVSSMSMAPSSSSVSAKSIIREETSSSSSKSSK